MTLEISFQPRSDNTQQHVFQVGRALAWLLDKNKRQFTSITSDYSANTINEVILADTSGGDITVTLPPAADFNRYTLHVKKMTAANMLTIDGNGSETIDGSTTAVLVTQYDCLTLVSDGTEWYII